MQKRSQKRRKKPPKATRASLARQVDVLSQKVSDLQKNLKHATQAEATAKAQLENVLKAARQHYARAEKADAVIETMLKAIEEAVLSWPWKYTNVLEGFKMRI